MWRVPRGTRHGTCCHASYILFADKLRLLLFILLNIIHESKRGTLLWRVPFVTSQVLDRVRAVTRITSSRLVQARLLLLILLNIIYASKRVTLMPCLLTTLVKADPQLQILAKVD